MIGRILAGLILLVALAFGAFYAWAWHSEIAAIDTPTGSSFDPAIIKKGAQLAAVGDCNTCHTPAGAKQYSGGYALETPFGVIYGSNITPDRDTGIGAWSEAAFRRAMRAGVDRDGNHLYPAFPYDHFTKTTDSDIAAIYAFLMTREPVKNDVPPPAFPFPLNIRLSAAGWKLLFLHQGAYRPDSGKSEEWNRGAYLTESLGHCGACHTPRNILAAERKDESYAGGVAEGWHAPALDANTPAPAPWTVDQLVSYLRDGYAAQHGHVAGPMQPVVRNLATVSDTDVRAIAIYVSSLSGVNADNVAKKSQDAKAFAESRELKVPVEQTPAATTGVAAPADGTPSGAAIFAGACATCHREGGRMPISRPIELGYSSAVNAPNAGNLIQIVLNGIHQPIGKRGAIMPAFGRMLTDQQIIALATYVRGQFSQKPAWDNVAKTLSDIRKPQR